MRRMSFVFAGSFYVLSACGGSQAPVEAAAPSAAEAEPTTPEAPPSKPFDELTQQEKFQVMKKVTKVMNTTPRATTVRMVTSVRNV